MSHVFGRPAFQNSVTSVVGTHRGSYRGVRATGNALDLPVAIFIGLRDGLMSGERFYYDRATLLAQIGISFHPSMVLQN